MGKYDIGRAKSMPAPEDRQDQSPSKAEIQEGAQRIKQAAYDQDQRRQRQISRQRDIINNLQERLSAAQLEILQLKEHNSND